MHSFGYYKAKVFSKILHNHEVMVDFYRSGGAKIGKRCLICTDISGKDLPLLEIGDDTVISVNTELVLHDYSASRVIPEKSVLCGKIKIGNNCFVGARSVIMYGVELADNIIVAAGSVVTKSFRKGDIIIGGNPARVIGDWDTLREKCRTMATDNTEKSYIECVSRNPDKLVKR